MKKQDVEIINIEVQNLKDSITWWQNRFNAVERNNRDLKVEVDRLNNIINELEKDFKNYDLQYLYETNEHNLADFIETELDKIKELKGDGNNE